MISLKDYAKNKNVSYEAVRKQVHRYKNELEGHIHKVNRTQYLDDEAVAFLDSKRTESPVILLQMDKDEEIQRLSDENKALLVQIAQIQNELIQTRKALPISISSLFQSRKAIKEDFQPRTALLELSGIWDTKEKTASCSGVQQRSRHVKRS